jgi:hypothetical protein
MRHTSIATSLAAVALIAAPVAAQQAKAIPASSNARVLASYDFWNAPRDAALPRSVTISDSAGTIIARADLGSRQASVPMTVTVIERNLVLQGMTPEGVLTLVLDRQNEGGETRLTNGSWSLVKAEGQLRGRVQP